MTVMITEEVDSTTLDDEDLRSVALELMYNNPEKWQSPEGATAPEIAKRLGLTTDTVKKKLRRLLEEEIIRVSGMSPKRWQFDEYKFQRMDHELPIIQLISRYDDDDFHKFYF